MTVDSPICPTTRELAVTQGKILGKFTANLTSKSSKVFENFLVLQFDFNDLKYTYFYMVQALVYKRSI